MDGDTMYADLVLDASKFGKRGSVENEPVVIQAGGRPARAQRADTI
jgi:hypothetical protein